MRDYNEAVYYSGQFIRHKTINFNTGFWSILWHMCILPGAVTPIWRRFMCENYEFCIKNEKLCIITKNFVYLIMMNSSGWGRGGAGGSGGGLVAICIKTDEYFLILNDGFCIKMMILMQIPRDPSIRDGLSTVVSGSTSYIFSLFCDRFATVLRLNWAYLMSRGRRRWGAYQ